MSKVPDCEVVDGLKRTEARAFRLLESSPVP